jgi:CcmD family protein
MEPKLVLLAATSVVVWLGVFFYMLSIDRKLARLDDTKEQDDL